MAVKFLCESCQFEVTIDVDICPNCGRQFSSVLCPRCRKEGKAREFRNGCPRCGYLKEYFIGSRKNPALSASLKKEALPRWFYSGAVILLSMGITALLVYIILSTGSPK
jgi:predicted amidophosphoribosyltransferase